MLPASAVTAIKARRNLEARDVVPCVIKLDSVIRGKPNEVESYDLGKFAGESQYFSYLFCDNYVTGKTPRERLVFEARPGTQQL